MAVPTAITDLSETAASNSPAGSTSINSEGIDNHLRAGYAFIAELYADKANLASPSFTGTVTAASGGNTTPALVAKQAGSPLPTAVEGTMAIVAGNIGSNSYYTRLAVLGGGTTGASIIDFGTHIDQAAGIISYTHSDNVFSIGASETILVDIDTTSVRPRADNSRALGGSSNKWSTVYAATGTINTSDSRLKTDVADSVLGLDFINALRPVSYKWIVGGNTVTPAPLATSGSVPKPQDTITPQAGTRTHWGFLAQEVKAAVDVAGVDFGGWVLTDANDATSTQALRYEELIAPLVKAVQELTARVAALEGA